MTAEALTVEEALAIMAPGDMVHTFRAGAGMVLGCDCERTELEAMIREAPRRGLAGEVAASMGHGLYIVDGGRPLFIATIEECEAAIEVRRGERPSTPAPAQEQAP